IPTVTGGGFCRPAGAVRHGVARALLEVEPEYRPALKKKGFLTRDPRMKERYKYGLKKARKASQLSKRRREAPVWTGGCGGATSRTPGFFVFPRSCRGQAVGRRPAGAHRQDSPAYPSVGKQV